MVHPDHIKSWTAAVNAGFIKGNPAYYYDRPVGYQADVDHALIVSILEAHGVDWRNDTPPVEPPVEPPTPGWGDGRSFGSRNESGVIHLRGESGVTIENLFFEGHWWLPNRPHNAHVSILLEDCTDITIRNCDFQNVSEPVAIIGGSNITVEFTRTNGIVGPGSRVDEQTGNFLQTVNRPTGVRILDNKIIATTTVDPWNGAYETMTEDVISLFSASNCEVSRNQIDATGYTRDSGTGIIAGDANGDNHLVSSNTLLNPGQVGLATAGGFGHRFLDNKIWKDRGQFAGSGNTAAYFWGYQGNPIGDGLYRGNRAKWHDGGGLWVADGTPTPVQIDNDWDDDTLDRDDLVVTL